MKAPPILIGIFAALLAGGSAEAWDLISYSDAEVAERAEVVALAHIKEGSIKKVFHGGGSSYEHRAILVVSRVIKGRLRDKELPIIIHYGLLPVSARSEKKIADGDAIVRSPPEERDEPVRIYEDNSSAGFSRPSGDVHTEQIWLLRHHRSSRAKDRPDTSTTDLLGIWDREDLQPPTKERDLAEHLRSP